MIKSAVFVASALFAFTLAGAQDSEAKSSQSTRVANSGVASWYSAGFRTASGARFNPNGMTAAHRTLPFGSRVLVSNPRTGRSVLVTINDRGPFVRGRIIDLARGAAQRLGMIQAGAIRVTMAVVRRRS